MQRAMRRAAGAQPDRAVLMDVLREAIREIQPANLDQCLAEIDAAEATPEDRAAQARVAVIENAVAEVPGYAAFQDSIARHIEAKRYVTVQFALRGWSGPGLPPFFRVDGMVPDKLMDALPAAEVDALYNEAAELIWLGPSAVGNSEAPSPSPESPAPSTEG